MGSSLPKRTLGKTGLEITALGLGGVTYNLRSDAEAVAVVNAAIDLGVNYIDTACGYSRSEEKIGLVLADRRDEVILATKTNKRDYATARAELEESFRRLHTDHIDIVQIHDLATDAQLAEITGPDGAIKAIEELRLAGKVDFIGLTGHRDPDLLVRALQAYPFDTLLTSLGAMHAAVRPFYETVMPVARAQNVGVLGMKAMAYAFLAPRADAAVRYVTGLEGVTAAIVGVDNIEELTADVAAAAKTDPLTDADRDDLVAFARAQYESQPAEKMWFIEK